MPAQIFFCVELPGNDQNFLPKIGPIHSFILKKYFLLLTFISHRQPRNEYLFSSIPDYGNKKIVF